MQREISRRVLMSGAGAIASLSIARASAAVAARAPAAPVTVAKCQEYGPGVARTLGAMFDQLGGLARLVKGKTVAIKLNLTGNPSERLGYLPAGLAHWVHEDIVGATVHLLGRAGAHRIRLLESAPARADEPLEEFMIQAGWDPRTFVNAAPRVEFENTNFLGRAKPSRFHVPRGGHLFPAYDLNHSYEDCDVFVSLAKLKEHANAGITLSMKNCFGITPSAIYSRGDMFHYGRRQPPQGTPPEKDPSTPRQDGYRVPRVVADLVAARPIQLAIVDGIQSMAGGEGPWIAGVRPCRPGVLLVGTNCVNTDAVGAALMGFDPVVDRGVAPFEGCDSTLRLAEELGVGTRDLTRIEVRGTPIRDVVFKMRGVSPATTLRGHIQSSKRFRAFGLISGATTR